jgi:hypothetical protein
MRALTWQGDHQLALTWVIGRCASCSAALQVGGDGYLVGCEHTGKRNLSWEEQRLRRVAQSQWWAGATDTRRIAFPQEARRLAQQAPGATETPHPVPEVPARPAEPSEVPSGAAGLRKAAVTAGWTVSVAYARGYALGSRRPVASVVVRARRGDERAVACWETDAAGRWKADGAWLLTPTFAKVGVQDLRAYITRPDRSTTLEQLQAAKAARKEAA